MWDFTTNKVNSRSLRVLMTDDQAYNIWQSACISLLPKRKKHQSIHKWVVFLLIVYDSTVRSGDLFWLRLNLKHMERLTSSCGSFVQRGPERYQGIAYHSDTGCQQGFMVQEGKWQCGTCLFSHGMRRYCDTRLCTSVKTGTAVLSPKIVNCNKWYNCLLHIC